MIIHLIIKYESNTLIFIKYQTETIFPTYELDVHMDRHKYVRAAVILYAPWSYDLGDNCFQIWHLGR